MNVNILGSGIMANQIAALMYLLGNNVFIWSRTHCDIKKIERQIKIQRRILKISSESKGTINLINHLNELEDALTIESVVEDLTIKRELFNTLRNVVTKGYFTNSSSFSPNEIGDDVGAFHFFNPIHQIKLVESYIAEPHSKHAIALLEQIKLVGINVAYVNPNNRGYIANFLLFNEIANIFKLIEVYKTPITELRTVFSSLGSKDAFTTIDIVGVDVTLAIIKNLNEQDCSTYIPNTLINAKKAGVLGKKNNTSIKDYVHTNT